MGYHPRLNLPIEFALAAACCRWAYSGDGETAIRQLAAKVDWSKFLEACRRHRVQGLAWQAVSRLRLEIPPAAEVALSADARQIAAHGLRAARESARLADAYAGAGLPLLFLKGLALGRLAYGDPFLKMGWDIDILVAPDDIGEAATVMRRLGYRLVKPQAGRDLLRWHAARKESVWRSADGLLVELHGRVADQPQLLPGLTVSSPSQMVTVAPGIDLATFADDELFAYLCVHGASSAWFRLKWLADLAGLVHRRSADEIEALHARAEELRAGRAAGLALLLANWLFAIPLSASLSARLPERRVQGLARACLRTMLRGEPTARPLGTLTIHLTQFFLLPGIGFKLSELRRQTLDIATRS